MSPSLPTGQRITLREKAHYVAESFDRPCYFLRIKKRPAMLAGLFGNSVCFIF